MIFIFNKKYEFIGEVDSLGDAVDNFLLPRDLNKDECRMLSHDESYSVFSKKYKFIDGNIISLLVDSDNEILNSTICILLNNIVTDLSYRLTTGIYSYVCKMNVSCTNDNIAHLRNVLNSCNIQKLNKVKIYDTYSNPVEVSVADLANIIKEVTVYNVKLISAVEKFKFEVKFVNSADEANKLYISTLSI